MEEEKKSPRNSRRRLHTLRCLAAQTRAERNILLADGRSLRQVLPRGPDLLLGLLLAFVVLHHEIPDRLLEVQRSLFHLRVQLAVDEDAGIQILLRQVAEVLVLGHNALVDLVDFLKVFIRGLRVAVDFVLHNGSSGRERDEALHEEEVGALLGLVPVYAGSGSG